ncbi:unnamed protein product, partial [Amoebophrya sp. A25]
GRPRPQQVDEADCVSQLSLEDAVSKYGIPGGFLRIDPWRRAEVNFDFLNTGSQPQLEKSRLKGASGARTTDSEDHRQVAENDLRCTGDDHDHQYPQEYPPYAAPRGGTSIAMEMDANMHRYSSSMHANDMQVRTGPWPGMQSAFLHENDAKQQEQKLATSSSGGQTSPLLRRGPPGTWIWHDHDDKTKTALSGPVTGQHHKHPRRCSKTQSRSSSSARIMHPVSKRTGHATTTSNSICSSQKKWQWPLNLVAQDLDTWKDGRDRRAASYWTPGLLRSRFASARKKPSHCLSMDDFDATRILAPRHHLHEGMNMKGHDDEKQCSPTSSSYVIARTGTASAKILHLKQDEDCTIPGNYPSKTSTTSTSIERIDKQEL